MTSDGTPQDLIQAVADAVRAMPLGHVKSLADAIRLAADAGAATPHAISAIASAAYRSNAHDFLDAWAATDGISGEAAALALLAAAAARESALQQETVEVVWTGPASHEIPVRRTREVLLELIGYARDRLTAVSFAAYKVPEVLTALDDASKRGVDVRLVLESAEDSHGRLTHDAAEAFASLQGAVRFFVWPSELRSPADRRTGALHAKAVIADRSAAFVTSANLTGHALTANMELGLLVRGGDVPGRLDAHFDELVSRGILRMIA